MAEATVFTRDSSELSDKLCRVPRGAASSFLLWNVCSPSPMRFNGNLELCERFTGMLPLWDHQGLSQAWSVFLEGAGPSRHTPVLSEAIDLDWGGMSHHDMGSGVRFRVQSLVIPLSTCETGKSLNILSLYFSAQDMEVKRY